MNKHTKQFTAVASTYGLTVKHGTKHLKVYNKHGHCVATAACTGSWYTLRETMRALRRAGYVDDAACKIKYN